MNENADVGHFKPYCYVIALVLFYVPIKKEEGKKLGLLHFSCLLTNQKLLNIYMKRTHILRYAFFCDTTDSSRWLVLYILCNSSQRLKP